MQIFGWVGLVLIQTFYVPQTIKILRTRDVTGLALLSWVLLWLALSSLLIYSIAQRAPVFIAGNTLGMLQSALMIGLILKYRGNRR